VESLPLITGIEQAEHGIVVTTLDGTIRYVNPAFTTITGYTREEAVGMNMRCLKSGVHDQAFYRDLWETIVAGRVWRGDIVNKRKDDRLYVERMTIAPVRDGGAAITHFIAFKGDVTAEKAAEESRGRMAAILEATSDFVAMASPQGNIFYINRAGRRMVGLAADADLAGLQFPAFHPERLRTFFRGEAFPIVLRDGVWQGEAALRRTDGSEVPVSQVILAHKTPAGTVDFLSTIARDISERQAAEDSRRQTEKRYRSLFEGMLEGVAYCRILYDDGQPADFLYLDVNPAFAALTGLKDVVGKKVSEILPGIRESNPEMFATYGRVAATGEPDRSEIFVAGLERWFDVAVYSPEPDHFVAVFDNITDRKRAEEVLRETQSQFRQAQKMEAVGRLAGGVAHDFNNLIGVIVGYSELMLHQDGLNGADRAKLGQIMKAAESGAALTRQLLAFSRKQVLQPRILDLNALVANVVKMVGRLIGEDVELVVRPSSELGPVCADAGQVEQVILNLCVNSRDAMPEGGTLTLETANVDLAEQIVTAHGDVLPGRYVLLMIGDNGCGMSADTLTHIFEPFFTTKEEGKGTGLGLATVYGIVTQSGGRIAVESRLGKGTTFRIYLPRAEAPLTPSPEAGESRVVRGSETVLIVEDDTAFRDLACLTLAEAGYDVLAAANAREALSISASHRGSIHALVSDVVMPGTGGRALAEQLLAERPGLKVLFMSGYENDMLEGKGELGFQAPFLHKPFKVRELIRHLRAAFDGGDRS
jgi:two-component system, cell cycle sensor histidine kinase and response regulator CckA